MLKNNKMKKYLYASLMLVSVNSFADLAGLYHCTGKEVGTGTPFTCQMMINKTGETYASTATCDDDTAYSGTGIYDEKTHHLALVFINTKKAAETGVSLSHVKPDGTIVSLWTYLNRTTTGSTDCKKQK